MLKRIKQFLNIEPKDCEVTVYEKIDTLFDSLEESVLSIEMGLDLSHFSDSVICKIGEVREEIKEECGFIMPAVSINKNFVLQENEFKIYVRNNLVCERYVIPTQKDINNEIYDALKTVIYEYINDIFTNSITERYVNIVQKNNGWLIWNISNVLSIVQIKTILSALISAGKSIGNINFVFEKIGEQILSDNEYKDYLKSYNPQTIAKNVAKVL